MERKRNPAYLERRKMLIRHFLGQSLLQNAFEEILKLDVSYFLSQEEVPFMKLKYHFTKRIKENEKWNDKPFRYGYFHLKGKLPAGIDLSSLYLHFDAGSEGILFDYQGQPLKGFSLGTYSLEDERNYATLKCHYPLKNLVINNQIDLWIECQDNIYFRSLFPQAGFFHKAALVVIHQDDLSLLYDYEVLSNYLFSISPEAPYFNDILLGLEKVRDLYLFSFAEKEKEAKKITSSLLSLISKSDFTITCLGHSHLDLAWLWSFKESKKKALRTILNAIYLLERYPSFHYSISQPWQLEQIKELSPETFSLIQKYEKEGRIELLGGAYVENDLNNVGEEALYRQMLYGQHFYRDYFGHDSQIGFYPDDFGFIPALPSVLKDTNQRYFYSAKMRINEQSIFPYSSFIFEGLDGQSVLTHFSQNPYGYNGFALPKELMDTERNSKEKSFLKNALYLYGCGDGGGGPSEDMCERLPRMNHRLSLPAIKETSALSFFQSLEPYQSSLPHQEGEIYLENHRGTFSSQARNKIWNRYLEEKLRQTEIYLSELNIKDFSKELDGIWKEVLLYQFHDVLPGSSIKEVYEVTDKRYPLLNESLDNILEKASNKNYSPVYKKGYYVRNFSLKKTHYEKVGNSYLIFSLPSYGESQDAERYKGKSVPSLDTLDTKYFRIVFAQDGSISSLKDKETGEEYFSSEANRFRVFYEPGDPKYANWNILENYRNQPEKYMRLEKRNIKRYGPLYEFNDIYVFQQSHLYQTILIDENSRIIRIHHKIDWKDDNYLLKAVFPMNDMPEEVFSDTQFGYQSHSTKNDSFIEKAQYELCSYKWIELSKERSGFALFSPVRNGFYAKEGSLELTLLKSNVYPMEHMDQEAYEYDYALYPHKERLEDSDVDEEANSFSSSVFFFKEKEEPKNAFCISNPRIVLSCFKPSYDGKGFVIRIYNSTNTSQKCSINLPACFQKATQCNGLEDKKEETNLNDLHFKAFEIKTILLS